MSIPQKSPSRHSQEEGITISELIIRYKMLFMVITACGHARGSLKKNLWVENRYDTVIIYGACMPYGGLL